MLLRQIETATIDAWRERLLAERRLSPRSIQKQLTSLHVYWSVRSAGDGSLRPGGRRRARDRQAVGRVQRAQPGADRRRRPLLGERTGRFGVRGRGVHGTAARRALGAALVRCRLAVQAFRLSEIKAYIGHADIQTTMIYLHRVPRHDAAARLSAIVGAATALGDGARAGVGGAGLDGRGCTAASKDVSDNECAVPDTAPHYNRAPAAATHRRRGRAVRQLWNS